MSDFNVTARWVFPVLGPPLEHGILMVSDGTVIAAAKHGRVTADLDLGNVAIVPGFFNSHTHLDLTGARGQTPPTSDFTAWLRDVIAFRKSRTADQVDGDIRAGIAECTKHGTTSVYDVSVDGRSLEWMEKSPMESVVFHEFLGLTAERAEASYCKSKDWAAKAALTYGSRAKRALSPHAPYSVPMETIRAAFEYCRRWNSNPMPLAIHLAESQEEIELLERQSGPFVSFLSELGDRNPDDFAPNAQSVIELAYEGQQILFVHCNYLSPETLIPTDCSVVYCPRTHAAFGHSPHPFREFLKRGVNVRLGTDSLASNPDLSILAEARFIAVRHPDFDLAELLRIACGTLAPGSAANFAVVPLPDREVVDPHELLFHSELAVQSTWFRGECVYSALPSAGAPGRG